jgi:ATP-dependent DNA ligase
MVVFDGLAIAGADLRALPWRDAGASSSSCSPARTTARFASRRCSTPREVHDALVADGWEGTVAKRVSGRYRCGHRTNAWVKLKSPAAIERDRMRVASALRSAA